MFFSFSKYLIPGWQFHIQPNTITFPSCFVTDGKDLDTRYQTKTAQLYDKAYQLWNSGVLLCSSREEIKNASLLPPPTLQDEYLFICKYWGTAWAIYVLGLRLASLKNGVKELHAFLATRGVQKEDLTPRSQEEYIHFQSPLVQSAPLVAVIIPTLNRYHYLKGALHDLEKNRYKNIEVIVVDQSDQFDAGFYVQFNLEIKIIRQPEKKLWTARNAAILATNADYLLFFDDDSSVGEHWIAEHLKCLDFFDAAVSAGISLSVVGGKIPGNYNRFRWADQFDSGNAMVRREVFCHIGMFDEQFNGLRMGDGEFGFRCYKNGYKSISNPLASRVHFKAGEGGLREMGSWDGFRPRNWWGPKPVPSVIFLYKKYLPAHLYRHAIIRGILLSNVPYQYKGSSKMLLLSMLLTIIKSPLLYWQYKQSLKIGMRMLRKDDGIRLLKEKKAEHAG